MSVAPELRKPAVYSAEARLVLRSAQESTGFDRPVGQQPDRDRLIATAIEVINSPAVAQLVAKQLGAASGVFASPVGATDVISLRASGQDPRVAAATANAYANAYIELEKSKAVDWLSAAAHEIETQVDAIQRQIATLDGQIARTRRPTPDLEKQRNSLIQQAGAFRNELNHLQVQARLSDGGAQIASAATVPTTPVSPRPLRSLFLGFVCGALVGIGVGALREQMDNSIRDEDDVRRVSGDVPLLALVPKVADWRDQGSPRLVSRTDPGSDVAEAYRSLRTSFQFIGLDRPIGVIQLTSPSAGEGKTTTLANLGVAMATAGLRVIVVCCDLRRPRVFAFFGLNNAVGLSSVLAGTAPLATGLQEVPGVPGLTVLAGGPPVPNPSELLSHARTGALIKALRHSADVVLLDSPPTLPVTDAAALSRWADATVVVVSAGRTSPQALARTLETLHRVSAQVTGIVLNGVTGSAYSYGYGGYGLNADKPPAHHVEPTTPSITADERP